MIQAGEAVNRDTEAWLGRCHAVPVSTTSHRKCYDLLGPSQCHFIFLVMPCPQTHLVFPTVGADTPFPTQHPWNLPNILLVPPSTYKVSSCFPVWL
jgi:hypothetical protein